jgi:hypothetical protein
MTKSSRKNSARKTRRPKQSRFVNCKELKPDLFPVHSDVALVLNQRDAQRRDKTQELQTVVLPFDVALASDGSGNIQQVFANDPTNSIYWSSYRSNFDQYRVLGIRFIFEPTIIVGGSTATVRAPISLVTDYDDATGLTAYSLAETYSDHQRHVGDRRIVKTSCEAAAIDGWTDSISGSPVNQFWIKTFSSGNTASTVMGRVLLEYVVQFRGRGI